MFAFIWRKRRRTTTAHKTQSQFRPRIEPLEDRCLLSGGVLDPTFGSGGLVTTTVGGLSDAWAVATYPTPGPPMTARWWPSGTPPSPGAATPTLLEPTGLLLRSLRLFMQQPA
jgi:hypothetical protein